MFDIRRREFITLLGGAAAWPLAARAQQPAMPVLGFLRNTSANGSARLVAALHNGLKEADFVEGQNVEIEYRWTDGQSDRLRAMAADLVRRRSAVIIGGGYAAALAAKAATATIPIVFATGDDPIQQGLVTSLSRPTGNVTGIFFHSGAILVSKQLELLREALPKAVVIGMLINPTSTAAELQIRDAQAAARALGQQLHILHAESERDFDRAFATLAQKRASALVIAGNALFFGHRNAKSRTDVAGLGSTRTKARTDVDSLRAANAELEEKLAEALEQQAATSQVLSLISSSPGNLDPVFETILANATRLCEAKFGNLYLYEGNGLRIVATHNVPPAYAEARRRGPIHPAAAGALACISHSN